jgi:signal recognition particle GTPase
MYLQVMERLLSGNFTLRLMREQFQNIMKMGPMSQVKIFD